MIFFENVFKIFLQLKITQKLILINIYNRYAQKCNSNFKKKVLVHYILKPKAKHCSWQKQYYTYLRCSSNLSVAAE